MMGEDVQNQGRLTEADDTEAPDLKLRDQIPGKVYLVGAGPGAPGLITLRGVECLRLADLVLYDGLVNPLLLKWTSGICERTARTRTQGEAWVPQQEINARLISEARAGRCVVRLKGGDPCIFGRGGEEEAALRAAGIPYEIVPGITAATAAAGYAGFSLTHRESASAVAFVTGHQDPTQQNHPLDYRALAAFPGTLVFYMGFARITELCGRLTAAGMSSDTPAAVVCHASLPSQKIVIGTLATLPNDVMQAGLRPPSLIIVGQCVAQRASTSWFETQPLFGLSIGITRPEDQASETMADVIAQGGEPVLMPMLKIAPVDEIHAEVVRKTLSVLQNYDWLILTSSNGVHGFVRHLMESGRDLRATGHLKIAAIGQATAATLRTYSLSADLIPPDARAESLAETLIPHVAGKRCLWACASRTRDTLSELLKSTTQLKPLVVYQNLDADAAAPEIADRMSRNQLNWVGLSSPASVLQFRRFLDHHQISPQTMATQVAVISKLTAEAAHDSGIPVAAVAAETSWSGILRAIAAANVKSSAGSGAT